MTHKLRAAARLLRMVLHGLHGLAIVLLRFPSLDEKARHARIQWWSVMMLHHMGLKLEVRGHVTPGAKLLVANHISWLDITAIHAVCPQARFVSRAEVKGWPLISRLVDSAGTLYIERTRKRDALRLVHQMAQALSDAQTVAVFPEGTTSDGHVVLPFHANPLQAAIATSARIQPIALRFSDATQAISQAAAYLGATTLAESMWRIVSADGLVVHVTLLPPRASAHADRRLLAQTLREDIQSALEPVQQALGSDIGAQPNKEVA